MKLELNKSTNDQELPIDQQPKIILTTQKEINQLSALLDSLAAVKLLNTINWNDLRAFLDQQCNFSGKQYKTSVEEKISPEFVNIARAEGSKFHGAGREDIDVRMLGEGRPFILELIKPKTRFLELERIQKKVNKRNKRKVRINELKYSNKEQVKALKLDAENTRKVYKALTYSNEKVTKDNFGNLLKKLKDTLENKKIHQRTPVRVSHRRADKIRDKKIFLLEGKFIKPDTFEFLIETQGGTYIKELISGDNGRTTPSFTEIFGFSIVCKKLDVLKIC